MRRCSGSGICTCARIWFQLADFQDRFYDRYVPVSKDFDLHGIGIDYREVRGFRQQPLASSTPLLRFWRSARSPNTDAPRDVSRAPDSARLRYINLKLTTSRLELFRVLVLSNELKLIPVW